MRQILIAPNAFKSSLSAPAICRILQEELSGSGYPVLSYPLGDGGDGTAEILASYFNAQKIGTPTLDALGRPHTATYYRYSDTAIIELAEICGLKHLKPSEYDVENANTAGLGRVICEAVKQNAGKIILCIGGSASIDGGTGALVEMGLKIVKRANVYRNHIIEIESIDISQLKKNFTNISFTILCDVENPLTGQQGAATIFGPQKGASVLQVSLLDRQLVKYAGILQNSTGTDMTNVKHGGAAGGVAAAFSSLLKADLLSGAEYCINLSGFTKRLDKDSLVITGEGKIDGQSLYGKIPGVIAALCWQQQAEVIAIAGIAEDNTHIFRQIFVLSEYAGGIKASLLQPERFLRMAARDIKKMYLTF